MPFLAQSFELRSWFNVAWRILACGLCFSASALLLSVIFKGTSTTVELPSGYVTFTWPYLLLVTEVFGTPPSHSYFVPSGNFSLPLASLSALAIPSFARPDKSVPFGTEMVSGTGEYFSASLVTWTVTSTVLYEPSGYVTFTVAGISPVFDVSGAPFTQV